MKKINFKGFFKKYKKTMLGSVLTFACFLSISIGASLSFSNKVDFGSKMANVIRCNNSKTKDFTYWRCEPIEARRDWLGWGVKSYLTSLSNPWAVYGDQVNNNCFLYTDANLGQTFIQNADSEDLIPISVFASPSSRSLSCFGIQLKDKKAIDTKNNFYCSESLANLLNYNLEDQKLVVKCGDESINSITFSGVVESFKYDLPSKIINEQKNFIIVPYVYEIGGTNEIISYDMKNFTGQSTFYAVLKNDRYENNYYSLMIDAIYQMSGVKDQLCYKATYIDSLEELFLPYDSINSNVQNYYVEILTNNSKDIFKTIFGIALISIGVVALGILIWKQKNKLYELKTFGTLCGFSLALIIFWLLGEIFYYSKITNILFWDIGGRILSFSLTVIVMIIFVLIFRYNNKNRHEVNNEIEYYSIDI
jgi:hypothetical protein